MPRFADLGSSVWSAPGATPAMIGFVLAALGAILFLRSRKEMRAVPEGDAAAPDRSGRTRAGLTLLLCFTFGIVLIGHVPFMVAAFLFMLAFILIFDFIDNRDAYRDHRRMALRAAVALVVAAAAAWAISHIFQDVFFVRLP